MYDYGPHNIRLPSSPESAAGAAQMLEMVASFQDRLVGVATDTADRDSKFSAIPPGSMVVSYLVPAIWMRTSSGWYTVWQTYPLFTSRDPGQIDNAGGWDVTIVELARNGSGHVDGRIAASRTSTDLVGTVNGSVPDTGVLTIRPAFLQPRISTYGAVRTSAGGGWFDVRSDGGIYLTALVGSILVDQTAFFPISYQGKDV